MKCLVVIPPRESLDKDGHPHTKLDNCPTKEPLKKGCPSLSALFVTLALSLFFPSNALATSVRTIFAALAEGTTGTIVTLKVSPGQGLNINLIPTGEEVKKAWIDDPSQIALSFDGNLCQSSGNQQQECADVGATVIHLRQIKPINFPALPRSRSRTTLLTLITEGASGRKLYQFKVVPISDEPEYTTVTIEPNPEKLTPIIEQTPTPRTLSDPKTAHGQVSYPNPPTTIRDSYFQQAIINANAAAYGLAVAQQKGQIILSSSTWIRTQKAIEQLRRGKSIESAAASAEIPIPVLKQLITWGQQP